MGVFLPGSDAIARLLERSGGEHGAPRDASMRWLRELERAQWTLRGQGPAAPASAPLPRAAQGAPTTPGALRAAAREGQASKAAPASEPQPGAASRASSGYALPSNPPAGEKLARQSPPSQRGSASMERRDVERPDIRPPAQQPAPARTPWPRVNVHAYRGEEALDVWVRDSSLDEGGRRRLAAELRAGLAARGQRLGALVVNGETIIALGAVGADADHEPRA